MPTSRLRAISSSDYDPITACVDAWWGGRPVRALLPRLFFEHFQPTSFVLASQDVIEAFLIGFISQTDPRIAYVHFVGVDPALRGRGIGRMLYEHFFDIVRARGCTQVCSIISPANKGSIDFHRKMGFAIAPGTGEMDGVPVHLDYAGPGQHRVRFSREL